jgi:hypothetical protein
MSGIGGYGGTFLQTGGGKIDLFWVENFVVMFVLIRSRDAAGEYPGLRRSPRARPDGSRRVKIDSRVTRQRPQQTVVLSTMVEDEEIVS